MTTRLPRRIWDDADPTGHGTRFWPRLCAAIPVGARLRLHRRCPVGGAERAERDLADTGQVESQIRGRAAARAHREPPEPGLGQGATRQPVRVLEIQARGTLYRNLTNALHPLDLPNAQAAALDAQRWRIEAAFVIAKRLLDLASCHGGAQNAVEMQRWATWMRYAVPVDLNDAVAEAVTRPFGAISMERVYRSLYRVVGAMARDPTTDPVRHLAENARDLGINKRARKPKRPQNQAPLLSA